MMAALFMAFAGALALALVLTPLVRGAALRIGAVDRPDHHRKTHAAPVPHVGGVAILIACVATMIATHTWNARLGVPVLAVFAIGLWDDLRGMRAGHKLAGVALAAAGAWAAGVRFDALGGWPLPVWCSLPLTVLWLAGCANAINLVDGVDGLAAGIALFTTLTTMAAALLEGHAALALATAPLAGALCGFLRYNFNPASIFLGDCGSLPLGFLLGAYGAIWSQKSATLLGMTAPAIALSVPLADTLLAIVRRFLSGQPIFGADRRHIHHRLLDLGHTPRGVALLLYAACAAAAVVSLAIQAGRGQSGGLLLIAGCLVAVAGIRRLGYAEFDIAGRLLHPQTFQRAIDSHMRLRALEDRLAAAATVDECWTAVRRASRELGFEGLTMRLDHTLYEEPLAPEARARFWSLDIPLSGTEYVKLSHSFRNAAPLTVVEPFAEILRRSLEPKLAKFHAGVAGDAPVRVVRVDAGAE